ncbi:DsbA family protein [Xanthobacter tagetidis]|uniref:DsbA family protein n=1 Tax=Xanthobacter tagetidis TaxID=60216 RepID=A0A3L7AG27_9HYPH|nr:DsbA family protein [Xanthobacter tagetidis]MBB6308515.1 protein-disulfide isomerase [Xanthobacter tagetidis]RLP78710.1 DsbA family protein [Xanthobacter tagetidis]
MTMPLRSLLFALAVCCAAWPATARAEPAEKERARVEAIVKEYLARHPEVVEGVVKDYLTRNPQVLQDAIEALLRSRRQATAEKAPAIRANAAALFASPHQVTLGNPEGDVTVVEFMDYNCGYCKRALADMVALIGEDPGIRFVLKELPVLGPTSTEAARVAVAVRMQDPSGAKYLAFHRALMAERGVSRERALAAATAAGLEPARIERDMASAEVDATLTESRRLAAALGIAGTPAYVVGNAVVPGAIGLAALKDRIRAARAEAGR